MATTTQPIARCPDRFALFLHPYLQPTGGTTITAGDTTVREINERTCITAFGRRACACGTYRLVVTRG